MLRSYSPNLLVLLSFIIMLSLPAQAGRRPQMVEDSRRIAGWLGESTERISKEGTDGVIVTKFRRIEISNGSSFWVLKVDCDQKTKPVTDILGKHHFDQPYDVPGPHGFYIRIKRTYSATRPKEGSEPWKKRDDGTMEYRSTIVPTSSPDLWLTVYCHRGSAISEVEAEVIDALLGSLHASFDQSKAEQGGAEQPATAPKSKGNKKPKQESKGRSQ